MIKPQDILIPFSILANGDTAILVSVLPYFKYENGNKTEQQEGFRYTVILPNRNFEKVSIKIPSGKPVITPEQLEAKNNSVMVRPVNCYAKFYFNKAVNGYSLTASADSIEMAGN